MVLRVPKYLGWKNIFISQLCVYGANKGHGFKVKLCSEACLLLLGLEFDSQNFLNETFQIYSRSIRLTLI
jgi:hypothetical protein